MPRAQRQGADRREEFPGVEGQRLADRLAELRERWRTHVRSFDPRDQSITRSHAALLELRERQLRSTADLLFEAEPPGLGARQLDQLGLRVHAQLREGRLQVVAHGSSADPEELRDRRDPTSLEKFEHDLLLPLRELRERL